MKGVAASAKRLSVKYQILLLLVVLCLFPFLGLLLYTVHDSVNAIHRQVLTQESEYLDKTRLQLESYKESAEAYFTSKAVKDVFSYYCYHDLDYRQYSSLKNAQGELENFSYGRDILGRAYFINFEYSYIIGSNFTSHYLDSSNENNPIAKEMRLAKEENQPMRWVYLPPWSGFLRDEKYSDLHLDGNILLIPYPVYSEKSQSVMVVYMDSGKAQEFLGSSDDPDKMLLITNEEDTIIYSASPEYLGKTAAELPWLKELDRNETRGVSQIKKDGKTCYLTWIRDDGGWIYCSLSSTSAIDARVNALRGTFLLFGGGVLLILLILIYLCSIWLYQPIDAIASKMRRFTRDVKEKNEFQIIEKGCEQYEEQMEIYKNSLKEFFLHKLLKSSLSLEAIQSEAERSGLCPDQTEMAVLVFQFLDIANSTPNPDVLAVRKIYSMLSLEFVAAGTYYQGLFVVWLQNKNHRIHFAETIQSECRQIKQELSMEPYLFALGQSPVFHEYSEVRAAYRAAVTDLSGPAEQPASSQTEGGAADPGADTSLNSVSTDWSQDFYPEALCEQMVASIQNGTPEETERLLTSFSKNVYRDKKNTERQEISTLCAAAGLFLAARKKGPIPCGVLPAHPLEMISKIHNANTMNYYFKKEIIDPLTLWMKDSNSGSQKELPQKVIELIQSNFQTDITLEQCAGQLDCPPGYLGQLFREQTGMTFSQYLDNYRFYTAKKWLLETGMPVAEIAEKLRYSNAQNFIRSFKKKTGMTPGKYRELNRS